MSIEVVGLTPLLANLARKQAEITAATDGTLTAGAQVVRDAWVNNIELEPLVLTGAYRDSITVEHGTEGEVGVTSDVPYAGILEFGDSRQAAHPVAQRAADENHEAVIEAEASHLRGVIR